MATADELRIATQAAKASLVTEETIRQRKAARVARLVMEQPQRALEPEPSWFAPDLKPSSPKPTSPSPSQTPSVSREPKHFKVTAMQPEAVKQADSERVEAEKAREQWEVRVAGGETAEATRRRFQERARVVTPKTTPTQQVITQPTPETVATREPKHYHVVAVQPQEKQIKMSPTYLRREGLITEEEYQQAKAGDTEFFLTESQHRQITQWKREQRLRAVETKQAIDTYEKASPVEKVGLHMTTMWSPQGYEYIGSAITGKPSRQVVVKRMKDLKLDKPFHERYVIEPFMSPPTQIVAGYATGMAGGYIAATGKGATALAMAPVRAGIMGITALGIGQSALDIGSTFATGQTEAGIGKVVTLGLTAATGLLGYKIAEQTFMRPKILESVQVGRATRMKDMKVGERGKVRISGKSRLETADIDTRVLGEWELTGQRLRGREGGILDTSGYKAGVTAEQRIRIPRKDLSKMVGRDVYQFREVVSPIDVTGTSLTTETMVDEAGNVIKSTSGFLGDVVGGEAPSAHTGMSTLLKIDTRDKFIRNYGKILETRYYRTGTVSSTGLAGGVGGGVTEVLTLPRVDKVMGSTPSISQISATGTDTAQVAADATQRIVGELDKGTKAIVDSITKPSIPLGVAPPPKVSSVGKVDVKKNGDINIDVIKVESTRRGVGVGDLGYDIGSISDVSQESMQIKGTKERRDRRQRRKRKGEFKPLEGYGIISKGIEIPDVDTEQTPIVTPIVTNVPDVTFKPIQLSIQTQAPMQKTPTDQPPFDPFPIPTPTTRPPAIIPPPPMEIYGTLGRRDIIRPIRLRYGEKTHSIVATPEEFGRLFGISGRRSKRKRKSRKRRRK